MRGYVGVTDGGWYRLLAGEDHLDEVNFWRPSGGAGIRMEPGELFLFKLHSPDDFIVGGGLFASFSRLPLAFAWRMQRSEAKLGRFGPRRRKARPVHHLGSLQAATTT